MWTRYQAALLLLALSFTPHLKGSERDLATSDPVLYWNKVLLNCNAVDHSLNEKDQAGPTRTSRAFAMVQLAVADSVNAIVRAWTPYLVDTAAPGASIEAAVGTSAYVVTRALYPQQLGDLAEAYAYFMKHVPESAAKAAGIELGRYVAQAILENRYNDGSTRTASYAPRGFPGEHVLDPLNPHQGYLDPHWGKVKPFGVPNIRAFRSPPPPSLHSEDYFRAFIEVRALGGDGRTTPTVRTPEQTLIGLYWSYDGSPGLGTPPRLYNQILQTIATNQRNDVIANARLFALVNMAMADAAIQSWDSKYAYKFWRPVVAIRAAGERWSPYGAPLSNKKGINFTPNFPAYPSGHATIGAAMFRTVLRFYGTDEIPFSFVSDELNGRTTDSEGRVRPRIVRHFRRMSQASEENGQSRIYLGIHWEFDKTKGIAAGADIADYVFDQHLR